jgi:superfamily II DNA helicase RecQ
VVADNKTLAAIATRAPRTETQLFAVPGMGSQRVARYGDEILRVIAEESSAAEDASTA